MKKTRVRMWSVVLPAIIAGVTFAIYHTPTTLSVYNPFDPEERTHNTYTLLFAGDTMLSRAIGNISDQRDDSTYPFSRIATTTRNADFFFVNLENPIAENGTPTRDMYAFRAHPRMVNGLTYAGVDGVTLANNHVFDYGTSAFTETLTHLNNANMQYTGAGETSEEAFAPAVFQLGKTTIAVFGFSQFSRTGAKDSARTTPVIAGIDKKQIRTSMQKAEKAHDIIIATFHWGEEYQTSHNQFQKEVARVAIDAGADLVVGHHPHVVQEVETYKDGYIAYSLGNFVFDQNFSEETRKGMLLEVAVRGGKVAEVTPREVRFDDTYRPYIATSSSSL